MWVQIPPELLVIQLAVAQQEERLIWDQEAAGSSPASQTTSRAFWALCNFNRY